MRELVFVAHNLRSTHNVGSLLRTAEGLGFRDVLLTGYTPYPAMAVHETRLPHEQRKTTKQISKTALGAESSQPWQHIADIDEALAGLRTAGYLIAALEQQSDAVALPDFTPPEKLAIVLGREVAGIEDSVLRLCDLALEIPMFGNKESYNVVQAAAMAGYHCRFYPSSVLQ